MNRSLPKFLLRSILSAVLLLCAASLSFAASSFRLVTSFGTAPSGSSVSAPLVLGPNGNYYGITSSGGAYSTGLNVGNGGTAFMLTPAGVFTTVASFNPATIGGFPSSLVLGKDGNFYGTCVLGGPTGYGTVFKMTSDGTLSLLHAFTGLDGANPLHVIQGKDNFLYSSFASGSRFEKISTATGAVTTISPGSANGRTLAIYYQDQDGAFVGTSGDSISSNTIVKVDGAGQIVTLHSFPASRFLDVIPGPDGTVYGCTYDYFTAGQGSIFQISTTGILTTLDSFTGVNVSLNPQEIILGTDGNFYGVGQGGVFKATLNGTVTPLVADGYDLYVSQGSNGDLFWFNNGKIPSIRHFVQGVASTFHTFGPPNIGIPVGPVIEAKDSNFYGTGTAGGLFGFGGIYQVTPSGALSVLASFAERSGPLGLTQASDGNFYGISQITAGGNGTIFKITPTGTMTTLHVFQPASDGAQPDSPLVQGKDGNLYGLTGIGGSLSNGTFYKISTSGAFTAIAPLSPTLVRATFSASSPFQLILGRDGNFYAASFQSIFQITPAGKTTLLTTYPGGNLQTPAGLAQGQDGNFYGITNDGGAFGTGLLFKLTPKGALTSLYSFGYGSLVSTGHQPSFFPTALALGNDGNLYVTVESIDQNGTGGLVQITPAGIVNLVPIGSAVNNFPNSIIKGTDGTLYGTTQAGGTVGSGSLFNVTADLLDGTIIGTAGSYSYQPGNTIAKAFDGDLTTYFDAPAPGNNDWVGLDLGSVQPITALAYVPRKSFESRMLGGVFQGSNTPDFSSGVVNLAPPIKSFPSDRFNTIPVNGSFRYVRYLSPPGGYGNISELQFFSGPPTASP